MADFKYEGNIDGISERQFEFVNGVLRDRGFKNETVVVSTVGKAGDNYAANVKRIVVEKYGETFKMIAKVAPASEIIRTKMPTKIMFNNEHVMYTNILPKFSELEEEAGISKNERLRYPICYGSLSEETNEIILLEDLEDSNFVMLDKFKSLTDETVKLVLRDFAKLHSLSFALKNQNPESYKEFGSKFIHPWVDHEAEMFMVYLNQLEESFIQMLDNDKHKRLVKGSVTGLDIKVVENYNIQKDSQYGVVVHGDGWTNNILFRLDGDKTLESCMIDYQLAHENNPVADLYYMIFSCTDYETRSKHYHEWINYYHAQLDKCLANFGLKAKSVYPREQLDADLKVLGKIYFGYSLMVIGMVMKESHEAALMNEAMEKELDLEEMMDLTKMSNLDNSSILRMKLNVEGLINSFLELGYIE